MVRKVYHVVPDGTNWRVTHNNQVLSNHILKSAAISEGQRVAKANQPSQLVIHLANGQIETEYTYGGDPYPPHG